MQCKTCQYRLWNLPVRECPECGTAFKPSEFEFVCNSIQFLCPHCKQAYYGTGERGHLVPVEFDCVKCGRHIHMDEMILLPTKGVEEQQTWTVQLPWTQRPSKGFFKAWIGTVWLSMTNPAPMMGAAVRDSTVGNAWSFALTTWAVVLIIGIGIPFAIISGVVPVGGVSSLLPMFMGAATTALVPILGLCIWGLLTHGILRATGGCERSIGMTFQALLYSAGVMLPAAVPCIGFYCGSYILLPWWVIVAVFMVKVGQGVHGGRAALAVITPPLLAFMAVVGSYVLFMVAMVTSMSGMSSGGFGSQLGGSYSTDYILSAVLTAFERDGHWPGHALQLVSDDSVSIDMFVDELTLTSPASITVVDTTLQEIAEIDTDDRGTVLSEIAQAAADMLPDNVVAHRLGDFVFTYHGIDSSSPNDPGLWVLVLIPDPEINPPSMMRQYYFAGLLDGSVSTIGTEQFTSRLQQQNALREANGLPPLPDLRQITHDRPAVSEP